MSQKVNNLQPVNGIKLGATKAGIKYTERLDLVLIAIDAGTKVSAVFTKNQFCAAPVVLAKKHLHETLPKFLLINTGYANAGLGEQGLIDARECCERLAQLAGCETNEVLPFSTGVIGERMPVDKVVDGLPAVVDKLSPDDWLSAAKGIMTTDTKAKVVSAKGIIDGETITVTGMAKGAGMICPNMATMLAFIATDARVSQDMLEQLTREVIDDSFHAITVDGDTSTNDACVVMATGKAGKQLISDTNDAYQALKALLSDVAIQLAKQIIQDAEGATKLITLEVAEGKSKEECRDLAFTIAHSPLVKTACFASDPNWGRILAAVGRANLPELELTKVNISINGLSIVEQGGLAKDYTEKQGLNVMSPADIHIKITLGRGEAVATVWTSDLSYDYVKINAEYRT